MSIQKEKKTSHLKELTEFLQKAKMIVVWDYTGLKANEIAPLRTEWKELGVVNRVYKNTVAAIGFKEANKEEINQHLVGLSSFLFVFDENVASLKLLLKLMKTNSKLNFKAGYVDNVFYDGEKLKEFASLPGREELLSMLLSVLQAGPRSLAYALDQVASKTKEG